MPTIIYLHGFGSTGVSPKSQALKDAFPNADVIAPTLPVTPSLIIQTVSELVRKATAYPIIFVGTSLGGFWANYFAQHFDALAVIVNPSTQPAKSLAEKVNKELFNYQTGEPIVVTADDVFQYIECQKEIAIRYNGALVHAFFASDDDVVDYTTSVSDLKFFKSCTITPTGGHRYDENWGQVIERVKTLV